MTAPLLVRDDVAVLSVICNEPEGPIERRVYPMTMHPVNLGKFWEKASQFRTLFTDDINHDFHKFCETLISMDEDGVRAHGLLWRIDDFVGVFYLTHITTTEAQMHYSFFDRRHRGRYKLTRQMIKWVFSTFGFQRLNAEVPYYVRNTSEYFIKNLGFVHEGTKRRCKMFDGRWWDANLYGILREEAEKWA